MDPFHSPKILLFSLKWETRTQALQSGSCVWHVSSRKFTVCGRVHKDDFREGFYFNRRISAKRLCAKPETCCDL